MESAALEDVNWETSTIRAWLNGYDLSSGSENVEIFSDSFINLAFSEDEKKNLISTEILDEDMSYNFTTNQWESNTLGNTNDKIYLLSYDEVTDDSYGFCNDIHNKSSVRYITGTAYCFANGCYSFSKVESTKGSPNVWCCTRTSYDNHVYKPVIDNYGKLASEWCACDDDTIGVVPAITLDLSDESMWGTVDDNTSGNGGDDAPQFTIKYNLNGGVNNSANPTSYFVDQSKIKLMDPTRAGYKFAGWYKDSQFTSQVTDIDTSFRGNWNLYAKWEGVKSSLSNGKGNTSSPEIQTPTLVKTTAPAKVTLSSAKNNKKKIITVKWKKIKDAKGYEVQYALNKKFTKSKKSKTTGKLTLTVKKLKKGKTYYVRVRAYKTDGNGNKVYGKWSAIKKVKVKK